MDSESERRTRRTRIDPKLVSAGWKVAPFDSVSGMGRYQRCAIEEYETDNGPADYAVCVDGVLLGVVEAKKLTLGPQNVLTQAERYSRGATNNHVSLRISRGDLAKPGICLINDFLVLFRNRLAESEFSNPKLVKVGVVPDSLSVFALYLFSVPPAQPKSRFS